jgi:hypothetical protein
LFDGVFRGQKCAAGDGTFHHKDSIGQSADDAVTGWEIPSFGFGTRFVFAYQSPLIDNAPRQFQILRRVNVFHPTGQNCHSEGRAFQRHVMSEGVDAHGKAADNG